MLRIALALTVLCWVAPVHGQGIDFDETDPDLILLSNESFYELGIRKSNGSLDFITDKSTGQKVSLGSRGQCLWVADFTDPATGSTDFVGGCHFSVGDGFSYRWSQDDYTLTLSYAAGPATKEQVSAQVVLAATPEPWFDLRLELQNETMISSLRATRYHRSRKRRCQT
ncbi:MAG: hypothetical protein GY720_03200 [bacterium]|nr:hypothetical protein [bacterium]